MTARGAGNILGITQMKTLTAKIPKGLETRLRLLARKRQETVSETVRKALDREDEGGDFRRGRHKFRMYGLG